MKEFEKIVEVKRIRKRSGKAAQENTTPMLLAYVHEHTEIIREEKEN